jgi:hypothetical protein
VRTGFDDSDGSVGADIVCGPSEVNQVGAIAPIIGSYNCNLLPGVREDYASTSSDVIVDVNVAGMSQSLPRSLERRRRVRSSRRLASAVIGAGAVCLGHGDGQSEGIVGSDPTGISAGENVMDDSISSNVIIDHVMINRADPVGVGSQTTGRRVSQDTASVSNNPTGSTSSGGTAAHSVTASGYVTASGSVPIVSDSETEPPDRGTGTGVNLLGAIAPSIGRCDCDVSPTTPVTSAAVGRTRSSATSTRAAKARQSQQQRQRGRRDSRAPSTWRPDVEFEVKDKAGIDAKARQSLPFRLRQRLRRDPVAVDVDDAQLDAAVARMWAMEESARDLILEHDGRMPGPEVRYEDAVRRGADEKLVRALRDGVEFRLAALPDTFDGRNYQSVRDHLLRYVREITRLLEKGKIFPVIDKPWLVMPCGFIVTQGGAKVRLVVDATASGLNAMLVLDTFTLPNIEGLVSLGHEGDDILLDDVTDMFLSIRLAKRHWTLCGVVNELTGQHYVFPWLSFGIAQSPEWGERVMTDAKRVAGSELEGAGLRPAPGDVRPLQAEEVLPTAAVARSETDGLGHGGGTTRPVEAARRQRWLALGEAGRRALVAKANASLAARSMDAQVIYVDDSGLVGVGTDLVGDGRRPPLLEAADIIADVLGLYGLFFKPTKRQGPASQLVFIGVGADIGSPPHLYLTDERRRKIRDELVSLRADHAVRTVTLAEVRRCVGLLSWGSIAYTAGHTYVRRMWDELAAVPEEHRRRGSRYQWEPRIGFWEDVDWWIDALQRPAYRRLCHRFGTGRLGLWRGDPLEADQIVATDSSDFAWGWVVYPPGFLPIDVLDVDVTMEDVELGVLGDRSVGAFGLLLPTRKELADMEAHPHSTRDHRGPGLCHTSRQDAMYLTEAARCIRESRAAVLMGERRAGGWVGCAKRHSINRKELRTALELVKRHGPEWKGRRVLLRIDNKTAMSYVNKGHGRSAVLSRLARQIHAVCATHGFELKAVYVNTKFNVVPDGLSRATLPPSSSDWQLCGDAFARLESELGPFWADMTSSGTNARVQRAFTEEDDAFAVDIGDRVTYWNPPWDIAVDVLRHIVHRRAEAPATEAVVVLPLSRWHRSGAMRRRFVEWRVFPSGTRLFTAPGGRGDASWRDIESDEDGGLEAAPRHTQVASEAHSPRRFVGVTRQPVVVVVTPGLADRVHRGLE